MSYCLQNDGEECATLFSGEIRKGLFLYFAGQSNYP